MSRKFDILIVGGGVIGLALARELTRLRAGSVAIVERGRPGREASFAAAGMLTPNAECEVIDDFHRLCDHSRRMYPEFAEELLEETGVDIELDRSGTLYAAFTETDADHLGLRYSRQLAAGIGVTRLSARDTLDAEPMISPHVRESLFFPDDWQVENRSMVHALERYALSHGVEILSNTAVRSLIIDGSTVAGVRADGEHYLAGTTVLATGAWTSLIKIGDQPVPFEVRPIRGQMICFRPSERRFRRVVYTPRGYLVPRADGRILVGATVEDVGFDDRVTPEAVETLRSAAYEIAPSLREYSVAETWSGLRPFAADGLPILGPVRELKGLSVATAHYRNGILLAPITARLIASSIAKGETSEYFELFGPGRLAARGFNAAA